MSRLAIVRAYQGDPYRGLYGDPGIFSIFKTIGKAALGLVPGGGTLATAAGAAGALARRAPAGAIARTAGGVGTLASIYRKAPKVAIGAGAAAAGIGAGALAGRAFGRERMLGRPRRRRGISARELRGFRKVARLLASVGMVPRRMGRKKRVC